MGQSLVKNHVHLVFSTKFRKRSIDPSIEHQLHNYIGGVCNNLECSVIRVGGYIDHIHILCLLSKKIALMNLLKEIKSSSSRWIKSMGGYRNFYWQNGYGAFSVKSSDVEVVKRYIENQHKHHERISFKKEFLGLLNQHRCEFDEQYIWD